MSDVVALYFSFFQAEDGIRDYKVTGVQTCALPIWFLSEHLDGLAFATTISNLPVRCFFQFLISKNSEFSKNLLQFAFFRNTEHRCVAGTVCPLLQYPALKCEETPTPHRLNEPTYICRVTDREIGIRHHD